MYQAVGQCLGAMLGYLFFLPVFEQLQVLSIYQVMKLRFALLLFSSNSISVPPATDLDNIPLAYVKK